eukprot:292006-Prymnesium_polylepis.1
MPTLWYQSADLRKSRASARSSVAQGCESRSAEVSGGRGAPKGATRCKGKVHRPRFDNQRSYPPPGPRQGSPTRWSAASSRAPSPTSRPTCRSTRIRSAHPAARRRTRRGRRR